MNPEREAKREYARAKLMEEVMELYADCYDLDEGVARFFNVESEKMPKKKIRVLTRIKNGEHGPDIGDEYFDILEDIPKDEDGNVGIVVDW